MSNFQIKNLIPTHLRTFKKVLGFSLLGIFLVLSNSLIAQTAPSGFNYGQASNQAATTTVPSKISCNPQYRQAIINSAIQQARADQAANQAIRDQILHQPPSQLMACVGSFWPNLNLSFPTMDQITKAAKDYVMNQACSEARNTLSQVTNPITSIGGSWASIPGLNVPGVGTGVSTGNSGGSCVTINGQQSCTSPTSGWTGGGLGGVL